jgi:hypothetical protein
MPRAHTALEQQEELSAVLKRNDYFILAATFISFVFSVSLWFLGRRDEGVFVGIWVPSILAFGVYLKLAMQKG